MALILDGKKIHSQVLEDLKSKIAIHLADGFVKPTLAIVQVGNNKESISYIHHKKKFGEKIGAEVVHIHLQDTVSEADVLSEIQNLNTDESVHGIIVQLPLPKHIDREILIKNINPEKDV